MKCIGKNYKLGVLFIGIIIGLMGCSSKNVADDDSKQQEEVIAVNKEDSKSMQEQNQEKDKNQEAKQNQEVKQNQTNEKNLATNLSSYFENIIYADTYKTMGYHSPLITQRLGADPYAIVYEGRVYIYMTGDVIEYGNDGKVKANHFGKINTLNVISSSDLVNWTDHGSILAAGPTGAATWGNNSWAPAVAYKEIDGKTKFFIYFANGGNGIGVLTADSPTGPFIDPIKHALISRATPNCGNVSWLFDPAVLVDDDNRAYLYFGGGIPDENYANPGTGRVVELGEDMISLACDPVALEIPYLFEDSGINKIGDTYYYSYCSNWNVSDEDAKRLGFKSAQIVYMTSNQPMGPFTLAGPILKNPGDYYGDYGTNHHCMFEFQGKLYIAYHTQILEKKLGISGGYRCTHIDEVTVNDDGSIAMITNVDEFGVAQVGYMNPYEKVEAETMGTMGGIQTIPSNKLSKYYGVGNMAVADIHTGDWIGLYGVDFGDKGATSITAAIKAEEGKHGVIQIRLDGLKGDVIGYLEINSDQDMEEYKEQCAELLSKVTGVHDLIFVFYGEGYSMDYWYFK